MKNSKTTRYFAGVTKLDEAHALFRKLAMQMHPDHFESDRYTDADRAEANERYQDLDTQYKECVAKLTTPNKRTNTPTQTFEKKIRKKMVVTEKQKKTIVHHASKLVGAVFETATEKIVSNLFED